jgi:hypothetical protein
MDYKRFFVVLAITAALTSTVAATSVNVGGSNKAFAVGPSGANGTAGGVDRHLFCNTGVITPACK